jgi:hypothetical protein
VPSTELENLRNQLAAQKAINEQLLRRLQQLEAKAVGAASSDSPLSARPDLSAARALEDVNEVESTSALEEALVSKGLVLLPVGAGRLTPSLTWAHSGQGLSRVDSRLLGLTLETGLPMGMALSVGMPYIWRDQATGTNQGHGDLSIALAKKFNQETDVWPAVVGKLSYSWANGEDPFLLPSIGYGFPSYGLTMSAFKRMEPLVLYGTVSYTHAQERLATLIDKRSGQLLYEGRIQPGDTRGVTLGVSLAATPSVSLDAGFSLQRVAKTRYTPVVDSFASTLGYVNLGANFLIHKNLSLNLAMSAGVTQGASDLVLSVALPYRF